MNPERTPRLERLLEQTARLLSGGGLHPVEILQRVEAAALDGARGGLVPNAVRVTLHPNDYRRYAPAFPDLREEVVAVLDRLERREGLRHAGDRLVEFAESPAAAPGLPGIAAFFAETANRAAAPPPAATQVIRRLRNATLAFGDGTRVPLTHTPFRLGRGPGNDVVYPDFTLSRDHAEIVTSPRGRLLIRDRGSRNGVVLDGVRVEEAELLPGRRVRLGDVEIWLEEGP